MSLNLKLSECKRSYKLTKSQEHMKDTNILVKDTKILIKNEKITNNLYTIYKNLQSRCRNGILKLKNLPCFQWRKRKNGRNRTAQLGST